MSELLLEFFSEEIPARMQARAEADLVRLIGERLNAAGLKPGRLRAFSGPRRIGLVAEGLAQRTEDVREERKGPRVGAPDKAVEGFLRSAGLDSLDQCETREDKKGAYYVAVVETPGRAAEDVIAEAVVETAKAFPWPKSMKFGEGERAQRWVRPLHRVVCLFDGRVVPLVLWGIESGNRTEGHRIHSRGDRVLEVSGAADHFARLRENGVEPDRETRRAAVLEGARRVCEAAGLALVEDAGLIDEVTGLVEHPSPILGDMDPGFLDLPPEVVALTMKVHQKYFAVRDPKTGALAPKFVMLANQTAPDGGAAIAAGAARVLSARLSDARHFWDLDRRIGLEAMAGRLGAVTFHEKLGSVADKVERVAALARALAGPTGADPDEAERAARLAKADLVSQMVYEFPELQGVMGRYYALQSGEPEAVADAIRDHYRPQGPGDAVPDAPVSVAAALADKLDTLAGFWTIDEKPTGSKDPFALRRAALGVIRLLLSGGLRLPLKPAFAEAGAEGALGEDLIGFFAERLKVHLREEGVRHDVIDAVFALGDDDLVRVSAKARALQAFLDTEDGAALLSGYRRAANILRAEEKKGFDASAARAEALADSQEDSEAALAVAIAATAESEAEKALIAALEGAETVARAALDAEDFEAAMRALAGLRAPVDAFFEHVTVNAEDALLRRNRLLLLSRIRARVDAVADFGRLEG